MQPGQSGTEIKTLSKLTKQKLREEPRGKPQKEPRHLGEIRTEFSFTEIMDCKNRNYSYFSRTKKDSQITDEHKLLRKRSLCSSLIRTYRQECCKFQLSQSFVCVCVCVRACVHLPYRTKYGLRDR